LFNTVATRTNDDITICPQPPQLSTTLIGFLWMTATHKPWTSHPKQPPLSMWVFQVDTQSQALHISTMTPAPKLLPTTIVTTSHPDILQLSVHTMTQSTQHLHVLMTTEQNSRKLMMSASSWWHIGQQQSLQKAPLNNTRLATQNNNQLKHFQK